MLFRSLHEGSDEVMLALYKINEVVFDARVVYPFMVYNYESESYEYRKNSFMKFNPFEKNKNYKMLTLSHHSPHGDLSGVTFDIYAILAY